MFGRGRSGEEVIGIGRRRGRRSGRRISDRRIEVAQRVAHLGLLNMEILIGMRVRLNEDWLPSINLDSQFLE